MANGKIIIAVILLIAVFGVVYLFNPIKTAGVINNPENTDNVIEMTSSGFTPSTLTISKGDTVTWINKDTEEHWPASAMHPTHTVYPGSNIEKCGTAEESTIFDACRGLAPGESYSFTFNNAGSWGYHDHLKVGMFGKIVVE